MAEQLFMLSLADIFSIYPRIFREILLAEELKRNREGTLAKDFLYLPSDADWQEKVYYRLLEVQKKVNIAIESGIAPEEVSKRRDKPIWDPSHVYQNFSPMASPSGSGSGSVKRKKCLLDHPIEYIDISVIGCWSLENISKAGKLLRKPPFSVHFDDEHEMRKVYSLIYDVFRYKHVLCQALTDTRFFAHHPQLKSDENRVWLLLFELYGRHFLKRHPEDISLQEKLYREADLEFIADCLWDHRVQLAAAVSRLRIKNGALQLSQLLPPHLQDEKVAIAAANPIVSGWMNPFKLKNKSYAMEYLNKMGMTEVVVDGNGEEQPLQLNQYRWDKICPLFISCIPGNRSAFAQSDLVRKNYIVMQDRTFSIAPAILSRLLDHFELDGDIVQTHVASPRSTAYLAALFYSVNRVKNFLAFGAGIKLLEYRDYINLLGVNNIRLYSENFCNIALESAVLETSVGIFATPPNSFSGVADPIDLICSRGGDLSMLEVLTESEISMDGKKRVAQLLEEQRDTLRLAMSRPQVQFVMYETHSIVSSENRDMVQRAVDGINGCAFEKHLQFYKEKKRLEALAELEAANIPAAALPQTSPRRRPAGSSTTAAGSSANTNKCEETLVRIRRPRLDSTGSSIASDLSNLDTARKSAATSSDDYAQNVKVPKTDEFVVAEVPDVCMNQDKCLNFSAMGFYVALIHRKQVTKLDAKYLIKMAETRGLFGSSDRKKTSKPKSSKRPEKKQAKNKDDDDSKKFRSKKGDVASLIARLNQPTHASTSRSHLQRISSAENKLLMFDFIKKTCPRHKKHNSDECYSYGNSNAYMMTDIKLYSRAKRWWQETSDYVNNLRLLEKQTRNQINKFQHNEQISPLHLSRTYKEIRSMSMDLRYKGKTAEKEPFPVAVTRLDFR